MNHVLSQFLGSAARLKAVEPTNVFPAGGERPDRLILTGNDRDLYTDTSFVYAHITHAHVAIAGREHEKKSK